jgi:hypothetical protein
MQSQGQPFPSGSGPRGKGGAGQPGLEPGIAGFGDRCLSQLGHCPEKAMLIKCGRRDLNPHGPKPTRT